MAPPRSLLTWLIVTLDLKRNEIKRYLDREGMARKRDTNRVQHWSTSDVRVRLLRALSVSAPSAPRTPPENADGTALGRKEKVVKHINVSAPSRRTRTRRTNQISFNNGGSDGLQQRHWRPPLQPQNKTTRRCCTCTNEKQLPVITTETATTTTASILFFSLRSTNGSLTRRAGWRRPT